MRLNLKDYAPAAFAAVVLFASSPAPALADHGHNCVWSGGAWVGQGLCPGMPGYVPHTDPHTEPPTPEPTTEPTPEATTLPTSAPSVTSPTPTSQQTAIPTPSTPAPTRTTTPPAPAPTRTPGCLRSYGNVWCSTGGATPAPAVAAAVVVAPVVAAPSPAVTLAFPGQIARSLLLPT